MIKFLIALIVMGALDFIFLYLLVKSAGPDPDGEMNPPKDDEAPHPGQSPPEMTRPLMEDYFGDLLK